MTEEERDAEQEPAAAETPAADKTQDEAPAGGQAAAQTGGPEVAAPADGEGSTAPRADAGPVGTEPADPREDSGAENGSDAPTEEPSRTRPEPRERRRSRFGRRRVCAFCLEKARAVDYKDAGKLRRYVSDRGRIEPRRKTGTCAKHQRWLSVALKRARHLALLPYSPEHIRTSGAFAPRRS